MCLYHLEHFALGLLNQICVLHDLSSCPNLDAGSWEKIFERPVYATSLDLHPLSVSLPILFYARVVSLSHM